MILCCGEALIDMLPRESREGEAAFAPYPGGAVFNTAVAAGRLGAPTGFFAGLSRDFFGEMLAGALAASGVASDLCPRSDRPTTLAFVRLVDGQASYAFYDEGTAGRMLSPRELPPVPQGVSALFFGGISLVSEPCGSAYEALMLAAARDRVTMIDPNVRPGFIRDEPAYRARIDRMLAAADIVTLHCPLSPATRHLIDAQTLAAMKPGAILVNTGRGALVDERALIDALHSGHLSGAGLDVFEREPTVPPQLLAMDNVTLTPHMGSATRECRGAMFDCALQNAIACFEGRPLLTPVDPG